jgi:outer membrane receptor protein involved in Fe transport
LRHAIKTGFATAQHESSESKRFLVSGQTLAVRPRIVLRFILKAAASCGLALVPFTLLAAPPDNTPIETIVVQGQKLDVETRIDRKIYSVPEDAQSTLGTLSDILNVIPSVDVDPDGVVSLRGDSNVLILINGKPATQLQGSKAGDNLQSISASDIERIEILTTPPAQFKAEGAAGVINIITRKRAAKETESASLTGSVGSGGRWLVGGNTSYGGKLFTASLSAGFREDYRDRTVQSTVVGQDPTTGQVLESEDHASQRIRRNVPSVSFSGTYDPNDRQSFGVSASWLSRGGLRTYTQYDTSTLQSGTVTSSTRRDTSGHDPEDDYDVSGQFTQKLSRPEETVDFSVHRSISHQHEHYDYVNDSFVPPAPTFFNNLDFVEDHGITQADIDYALHVKTQSVKLGYAFEQDDYGFDRVGASVDPVSGAQIINPLLTNDFKFKQRIHALYLSDQGSIGDWTWLAGLRAEWTTTDALQVAEAISTPNHYADIFPSLHIDKGLSTHSTLSFGASRRITRPDPSYLNPYVDYEYPPYLIAGNINLKPQYTQSFDLGYGYEAHGASYGLTGYYRRNTDSFTGVSTYLGNGLTLSTGANLPRSDSAGLEFSATGHLLPKLAYNLSGNAFYTQIDATSLGAPGLKSTTGINLKAKLDYQATVKDSAQITFSRTDKRLTPQGSVSAVNIVNVGFKHRLSPSLSAVLTISDLFDGQRYERFVSTPTLTQVYERSTAGRVVWFGLTYTVGVTKKEKEPNFEYDTGSAGAR